MGTAWRFYNIISDVGFPLHLTSHCDKTEILFETTLKPSHPHQNNILSSIVKHINKK